MKATISQNRRRDPILFATTFFLNISLGLALLSEGSIFAQNNDSLRGSAMAFEFGGTVEEVKIDEPKSKEYSIDSLIVKLQLHFQNRGSSKLISFNRYATCTKVAVAKSVDDLEKRGESFSLYYLPMSSDFIDSSRWKAWKKDLDKPNPPSKQVYMISPGDSISYTDTFTLRLPKAGEKNIDTPYWKQETLEGLKKLSPFYLRLEGCDLLGQVFKTETDSRQKFAMELRTRWQPFGHLLIDSFTSEPIFVDLGPTSR